MQNSSTPPSDPSPRLTLSPEDAAAADAILERAAPALVGDAESAAAVDPARVARMQGWLKTLGSAPAPAVPADLAGRTLERLRSERMKLTAATLARPAADHRAEPVSIEPQRGRSWWSRHAGEFAAMGVAASLLAGVVALGVFQTRNAASRVACAANLATVSNAFATYAIANAGELPNLGATPDRNWLRPTLGMPNSHSNADNLLPLLNAKLIQTANLVCPGRNVRLASTATPKSPMLPDDARGYSYANLFAASHPRWDGMHNTFVLADRNPLFDPQAVNDPQSNSANHREQGNYLLRADGSVTWEGSPNVGPGRDNIWTVGTGPELTTAYIGTETPATARDVFLSP